MRLLALFILVITNIFLSLRAPVSNGNPKGAVKAVQFRIGAFIKNFNFKEVQTIWHGTDVRGGAQPQMDLIAAVVDKGAVTRTVSINKNYKQIYIVASAQVASNDSWLDVSTTGFTTTIVSGGYRGITQSGAAYQSVVLKGDDVKSGSVITLRLNWNFTYFVIGI